MAAIGFVLLTSLPIALGAVVGRRLPHAQFGRVVLRYAVGVALLALVARAAFAARWFQPLGLLTPLFLGLCAALLADFAIRARLPRIGALGGACLGATLGMATAMAAWLAVPLAQCATPAAHAGDRGVLTEIADIAHRGFLRHLPVVGDLSAEVQALVVVVRATSAQQRILARSFGLDHLAELPAMQRALASEEVLDELDQVRCGSLLALYRLQRHPRVLELAECQAVRDAIADLRPTRLARKLR